MKKSEKEIRSLITPAIVSAAENVCLAKAITGTIRPVVEAYHNEILVRNQFLNKGEKALFERLGRSSEYVEQVVLDSDHTYLLSEEDAAIFEKERKAARLASGLKVESEDYCPLLVAEDLERKARRSFVDAIEPITHINCDQVLSSKDGIANLDKCVNLGLGLIASLGLLKDSKQILENIKRK